MDPNNEERPPADPAESLRLIREQQVFAARQLNPDLRTFIWPWGVAWLVGFGLEFLRFGPDGRVFVPMPTWLPLAVLLILLAGAAVLTSVVSRRGYGQTAGDSARRAGWYGAAWGLGYATVAVTLSRVSNDLPIEQANLLWAGVTTGVAGILQMAGGAIWLARNLFRLGIWITVINIVGVLAGPGWHALILGLLGGGGMLLATAFVPSGREAPE
ncbi:transporter [Plantactinospora siamensis]|uniref:Transporter n=1 Tax=Plantactinospora siamensis TaxID=555372 RepID=A0ABV6NRQ4_9ACTN